MAIFHTFFIVYTVLLPKCVYNKKVCNFKKQENPMKLSTMNRVLAAVLALGMTAALAGCGKHCFQRGYCRIRCYRGNR